MRPFLGSRLGQYRPNTLFERSVTLCSIAHPHKDDRDSSRVPQNPRAVLTESLMLGQGRNDDDATFDYDAGSSFVAAMHHVLLPLYLDLNIYQETFYTRRSLCSMPKYSPILSNEISATGLEVYAYPSITYQKFAHSYVLVFQSRSPPVLLQTP